MAGPRSCQTGISSGEIATRASAPIGAEAARNDSEDYSQGLRMILAQSREAESSRARWIWLMGRT